MAKLSYSDREKIPSSDFVLSKKAGGPAGKGSYPIPDKSHARNALSRVSQFGSSSEKATVRAKVHSKFPDVGKSHKPETRKRGVKRG